VEEELWRNSSVLAASSASLSDSMEASSLSMAARTGFAGEDKGEGEVEREVADGEEQADDEEGVVCGRNAMGVGGRNGRREEGMGRLGRGGIGMRASSSSSSRSEPQVTELLHVFAFMTWSKRSTSAYERPTSTTSLTIDTRVRTFTGVVEQSVVPG